MQKTVREIMDMISSGVEYPIEGTPYYYYRIK